MWSLEKFAQLFGMTEDRTVRVAARVVAKIGLIWSLTFLIAARPQGEQLRLQCGNARSHLCNDVFTLIQGFACVSQPAVLQMLL